MMGIHFILAFHPNTKAMVVDILRTSSYLDKTIIPTMISLSKIKGIGSAWFKQRREVLITHFSDQNEHDFFDLALAFLAKEKKNISQNDFQNLFNEAEATLADCSSAGISVSSLLDEGYPAQLCDLKDPPPIIYTRGNVGTLKKALAVIGTRQPDSTGKIIAQRVGQYFQEQGWSICNGLAEGIDLCTLQRDEHSYLPNSIGILACGLDFEHGSSARQAASIAESILSADGLLLSEQEPSQKADTYKIIASCRLQAGVSRGLILIQSSKSGGSKFALQRTAELKRPIGVIYPPPAKYDLIEYEANRLISEQGVNGLKSIFLGGKPEARIDAAQQLIVIKSKEGYNEFQALL